MPEGPEKAFYVTTPIYYVNDAPHIGHAYTTVAGDVLTRWHRQRGESVYYLTGTDEHGEKILTAAAEHGMTPTEWTDHMVTTAWQPVLREIDVANDDFIRTTQPRHTSRVQEFMQLLYDRGEVFKGSYTGPYCVSCEEFKLPAELVQPGGLCPIHGRPVRQISEDNYFFRLSAYTDRLLEHYRTHPEFVQPESARNEVVRFVEGGLQDLSLSRSTFDWGVQVPWDPSHVVYVWIDALQNYITAIGWNSDPDTFNRIWPADVHLVGKDILRFHAVIWPAMLMAAGLALPRTVFANGWLLVGGEKMSKTKLTGIAPRQITEVFGSDALRYYFLREIAYGADGSFSWESMAARYRSELADQFGNLASRLTSMMERYRGGVLPDGEPDAGLSAVLADTVRLADERMCALDFQGGLEVIFDYVRQVNGYVTASAPWQLAKDDARAGELDIVLLTTADALRACAVLLHPVMPKACAKLWATLGADAALGPLADQVVQHVASVRLPAGAAIRKSEPLFPRIEEPGS
jgi:methionyl-tRNA synthetase